MKQRRGIRRFVIQAGIFLLLVAGGAIVNIAVAWGFMFLNHRWTSPLEVVHNLPDGLVEVLVWHRIGASVFDEIPETESGRRATRRLECGLPLRALWSYVKGMEPDWGIAVGERPLPALPLWPGFAINTLFYAAILWLLFAATFKLRRWRRLKRGLCPACAYPVGASNLCTECGEPVPASTT